MDFNVSVRYSEGEGLCLFVDEKPMVSKAAAISIHTNGGYGQEPGYRVEFSATEQAPDMGKLSEGKTKEDARADAAKTAPVQPGGYM